jgi:selenocysteine lyase/cysteine desulfurase
MMTPGAAAETVSVDTLRAREYPLLDAEGHVYLDYTAAKPSAAVRSGSPCGSPSRTPARQPPLHQPGFVADDNVGGARTGCRLAFFNASPEDWVVIFTANATQALKLVGESYPFGPGGEYLLTFDNHNSVNGIREFARARQSPATYIPVVLPDMRVDNAELVRHLDRAKPDGANLFAYPAQSNFSGVQHPLDWIEIAHARGWDVLLDAASFTPTNRLDLDRWQPDFVVQSFYKIFGYPTGVGCLLARRAALSKLRRPWFAGGTISVASVQGDKYYLAEGEAAFEEGTPNYLALPCC